MNKSIEFTHREKYLINYYLDRRLSNASRIFNHEVWYLVVPLLCAGFFFWHGDGSWLFVAFGLLIYRVGRTLWANMTYSATFSDIFEKYEARLKELESFQKD